MSRPTSARYNRVTRMIETNLPPPSQISGLQLTVSQYNNAEYLPVSSGLPSAAGMFRSGSIGGSGLAGRAKNFHLLAEIMKTKQNLTTRRTNISRNSEIENNIKKSIFNAEGLIIKHLKRRKKKQQKIKIQTKITNTSDKMKSKAISNSKKPPVRTSSESKISSMTKLKILLPSPKNTVLPRSGLIKSFSEPKIGNFKKVNGLQVWSSTGSFKMKKNTENILNTPNLNDAFAMGAWCNHN